MLVTVIVPEFVLGQVDGEVLPVHAAAGSVPPLGVAPEPLQAVALMCAGASTATG
jgi:hypothetical protein